MEISLVSLKIFSFCVLKINESLTGLGQHEVVKKNIFFLNYPFKLLMLTVYFVQGLVFQAQHQKMLRVNDL